MIIPNPDELRRLNNKQISIRMMVLQDLIDECVEARCDLDTEQQRRFEATVADGSLKKIQPS